MPGLTERECYIRLYGWENYKAVPHYNMPTRFVKFFITATGNTVLQLTMFLSREG